MGLTASAPGNAVVDSPCERLESTPDTGMEHLELFRSEACEAELTGEPVGRQGSGSNEFAQCSTRGSQEHFEAEGPVLSLAESERVPSVVVGLGLDVRDAVPVSTDGDRALNALHGKLAAGRGESTSQEQPEEELVDVHAGLCCVQ